MGFRDWRVLLAAGLLLGGLSAAAAGASLHAFRTGLTFGFIACYWGCAAGGWLVLRAVAAARGGAAREIPVPTLVPPASDLGIEHVPLALCRVGAGGSVEAGNAAARRLLAPGGVADASAFAGRLAMLRPGDRQLLEFDTGRGRERMLVAASALVVGGRPETLVALLPVENELQAESMAAWEQLVHVLTHEIMNSLTPVASLSHTLRRMLGDAALPPDLAADADTALDAIARRAENLTRFVGGYRQLASVPEAVPQRVELASMFARIEALAAPAWRARGGELAFEVEPPTLELHADPGQIEQALVNLIRNAEEACAAQPVPRVRVSARLGRGGRLRIEVTDNGPGVPDDVAADVFTPFFSTKGAGRGTGLALVRQLVRRNGGTARYVRSVQAGARFVIAF